MAHAARTAKRQTGRIQDALASLTRNAMSEKAAHAQTVKESRILVQTVLFAVAGFADAL